MSISILVLLLLVAAAALSIFGGLLLVMLISRDLSLILPAARPSHRRRWG